MVGCLSGGGGSGRPEGVRSRECWGRVSVCSCVGLDVWLCSCTRHGTEVETPQRRPAFSLTRLVADSQHSSPSTFCVCLSLVLPFWLVDACRRPSRFIDQSIDRNPRALPPLRRSINLEIEIVALTCLRLHASLTTPQAHTGTGIPLCFRNPQWRRRSHGHSTSGGGSEQARPVSSSRSSPHQASLHQACHHHHQDGANAPSRFPSPSSASASSPSSSSCCPPAPARATGRSSRAGARWRWRESTARCWPWTSGWAPGAPNFWVLGVVCSFLSGGRSILSGGSPMSRSWH